MISSFKVTLARAKEKLEDPNSKAEDGRACECFTYFFFLLVFTVMCVSGRTLNAHNFWISNQFRYSLEEGTYADAIGQSRFFHELNEVEDIYLYLNQMAMPLLYVNYSYSGEDLSRDEQNFVLGHNKLLGGTRITVIRVEAVECGFEDLPDDFGPCYPTYSESATNTSNYRVSDYEMPFMTASEAQSEKFYGRFMSYAGNGNIYDLSPNSTTALGELKYLFDNGLIGRDVRVLFFDFVTLNANLNLHTVGRLCFELPADGGVITYSDLKTWRFWRYLTDRGIIVFVMEVIYTMMVVYYTWEEMSEIYELGFYEYRKEFWNLLDWVNLLFFYVTIFWRLKVELSNKPSMINLFTYESYRTYVWIFSMETWFTTVNGFLLYFKLFKYLNVSRNVRVLFTMFKKTASNLVVFAIILCVFYLAYGIGGFLVFSSDVSDYRTFYFAIINLFRYTVTDMDFDVLFQSSAITGTLYYMTWTLLMVLILANVFIAILSDGFSEAQVEANQTKEESVLPLMFIRAMPKTFRTLLFSVLDENNDGFLDKGEIARAQGITEDEAAKIIEPFDKNNDGKVDEHELDIFYNQGKTDDAAGEGDIIWISDHVLRI